MERQEDFFSTIEDRIGLLSDDARKGLLLLCLFEGKMDLNDLSELLQSPDSIDELMLLSFTYADPQSIVIESKITITLLQIFKWSERVRASESLVKYFKHKSLGKEKLGDLWLMAGSKKNAKSEYR